MSAKQLSRRAFLPLLGRPAPEPKPEVATQRPFSLGDFYAGRAEAPATLPHFTVRAPEEPLATTGVGVTRAPEPPWQLRRGPRAEGAPRLGGPVRVVTSACLAWRGSPCWTCSERCPVEGAITLDGGRPSVDVTRCDGCGECVAACPAPHNALKLAEHVPEAVG